MTTSSQTPAEQAEFRALITLALREHGAGRLDEAAAAYHKILALQPDSADTYNNLGIVLKQQGKLDQAVARFEQALALKPNYAEAHNNLGLALDDQRKLDDAAAQFLHALALRPRLFQAYYNLGNVLRKQGKLDQAVARFEQALAIQPNYADAHHSLGSVLRDQGRLDDAAARYLRATSLNPKLFQAHYNLGNVRREQGKLDQAVACFRQVIALEPDYAEAHNNLGAALFQQGNLDAAVTHCERAVALKPNLFQAQNNLGNVLRKQGKRQQAAARFEQAIALRPDYAEAHHNLGKVFNEEGRFAESAACFSRAITLRPDLTEAYYHLAEMKTFRAGDADLAALEKIGADAALLPPEDRIHVHFALGKALDDVGDYGRAFEQWLLGNALVRSGIDFDEAACQRDLRRTAEVFDASLLERFQGLGDPSHVPIFIVGMPRSGSTLVEQILASHPQVHAAGELKNLDGVLKTLSDASGQPVPFSTWLSTLDAGSLRRAGQTYLASLPPIDAGKTRITDKMLGNFLYVGLIRLILPNARIVHTMRDPIDTCVSCFSRHFSSGHAFTCDLGEMGRHYRAYQELMAHWRSVLPAGAMLDVVYEDVVGDLEQQARRLLDYCGLPWDDRCLNFHETRRPVATSSSVQVRRPLYRSSVARWRRYEAYLQPLLAELESCRQPV